MRVAVIHNRVTEDAGAEDQDTLVQVEAVCRAISRAGHNVETFACSLDLQSAHDWLLRSQPDVVFNLVESLAGADRLANLATELLDAMGLPYTGNASEATFLTNHKLLAKERLRWSGMPTPQWIVVGSQDATGEGPSQDLPFRPGAQYIIKPVAEHASIGMDDRSVVRFDTVEELVSAIRQRAARFARACFAEEFIEGREFNVALLAGPDGPEVLPPSEIDFSAFPPEKPHIVDYQAKWIEGSFAYQNTPRHFLLPSENQPLLERLGRLARSCWGLFSLAGYVRVDFRVDPTGCPWILEINTNPCIAPDSGFSATAEFAGIDHDSMILRILDDAVRRMPDRGHPLACSKK